MPDSFHDHLEMDAVERYVFDELVETELASTEEHLLVCEMCRQAVSEADVFAPLLRPDDGAGSAAYRHATADGPVILELQSLPESRWSAWIHGGRLDGRAGAGSPREAWAYLRRSFAEMFPEHLCDEGCGPVD
jgi:hypothetical protein